MTQKTNFLSKYRRVMTIKICEGNLFEDIFANDCETALSLMKRIIHRIMIEGIWSIYILGIEDDGVMVHLDVNRDYKEFKIMLYLDIKIFKRLFAGLVPDQQKRELNKLITYLEKEITKIDWPQFLLDVE